MATITDPILGVPSTILDIPDYQHEYVNTPVPYKDLLPVPQPPRGLVYPDNVPPVLANLNAMHPTDRDAQTLNTDGNHALLVSNVGAAGGQPVPVVCYQSDLSTIGFGVDSLFDMGPIGSVIYGITMAFTSDDTPSGTLIHHGAVYAFINSGTVDGMLILANCAIEQVGLNPGNQFVGNVSQWFGNGIIYNRALDPGNGKYRLQLQSTNIGGGHLTIAVWCSQ